MSMLDQAEDAVQWCKAEQAKLHENIQLYTDILKSLTLQTQAASIDLDDAHEGAEEDIVPREKEEIELVEQALKEALRIRSSSTASSKGPRCSREPARPNKEPSDGIVKPNDGNQTSRTRKGKQAVETSSKPSSLPRREARKPGTSSSSGARSKNVNRTVGGGSVRAHSASSSKVKHEKHARVGCSAVGPGKAHASVSTLESDGPPGGAGAAEESEHVSHAGDAGTHSPPPQKRTWPGGSPDQTRALVDSLTRQGQDLSHCYRVQKQLALHGSSSDTQPEWEAWDRWRPEGGCLCPGERGGQRARAPLLPPTITVTDKAELVELEKLRLRVVLLQQEVYLHQALSDSLSPHLPSLLCGPGRPDYSVLRDVYSLLAEGGERFPALVLDTEPD
ncbi:unnamed protein product [Merluccius merluccius]